jgi:hypothetical protein
MEERESEEQELFFVLRYHLEKKGAAYKAPLPPKCDHCSRFLSLQSGLEWLRPLLRPSPKQLWQVLRSRVKAC